MRLESTVERQRAFLSTYGASELALQTGTRLGARIATAGGLRRVGHPTLLEISCASRGMYFAARDLASACGVTVDDETWGVLVEEFDTLWLEIDRRVGSGMELPYPELYSVCRESGLVVYSLVSICHPRVVFESGVANGTTSFLILEGMKKYAGGRLVSTDIASDVGALVSPEERARWQLRLLRPSALKEDFVAALADAGPIDLFLHDSDHAYRWHRWELTQALAAMQPTGLVASDDVDFSYAFIDFCGEIGGLPRILVEERKAFGLLPMSDVAPFLPTLPKISSVKR